MKQKLNVIIPIIVFLFGLAHLDGQISEKFTLHGFGGWAYGNTDGYLYQYGDEDGSFDHAQFYLNINANPFKNLNIFAQFGSMQTQDGIKFEFDFAFAEWTFADFLKLRIGKVKQPFGIFGEVLNVGTIRPFMALPQGVYGPAGYVGTGLNGIALTGSLYLKNNWGLLYDIYWGQLKTVSTSSNHAPYSRSGVIALLSDDINTLEKNIVDLLGGRLTIATPLDGLSIGFSGYTGSGDTKYGQTGMTGTQMAYGPEFEYMSTNVWIRSEYKYFEQSFATGPVTMTIKTNTFYFEAAVKLLKSWQIACRYDSYQGDTSELGDFMAQYVHHRDTAIGLNYWLSSNLVLKLAYHMVEGIRFAFPIFNDPFAFVADTSDKKTKLIQFGVHFSF